MTLQVWDDCVYCGEICHVEQVWDDNPSDHMVMLRPVFKPGGCYITNESECRPVPRQGAIGQAA